MTSRQNFGGFNSPGVVVVDKPKYLSSFDVVRQIRKKLAVKKVGHGGTLDPNATGVLVCLLNQATRLAFLVENGIKRYECLIRFGIKTDTDDIWGELIEESGRSPTYEEVEQCLSDFCGEIWQVPPKVSAVKVGGKRAYSLHRRGESFEINARRVKIYELFVTPTDNPYLYKMSVSCGKGTYVRAIARDLGERLGVGCCVASIRRTYSSPFHECSCVPLDEIGRDKILPVDVLLPNYKRAVFGDRECELLRSGRQDVLVKSKRRLSELEKSGQKFAFYSTNESGNVAGLLGKLNDKWSLLVNF
ncbi:MAG: tRNA pseudouridine(55) synthase TruB [Candidatus Dadabacteria bacterium]|nr:MAG: tRNA pseudouridine(55) synthase TruB [Candidatus Dadabacteria bacterium]